MSATFEIRRQMNGIAEAPGKTWFWELAAGVIDAGRCIQCGTCVAACPSDSIGIGSKGLPALVKMCTGCSLCWDFCPRGGLRYEATWPAQAVMIDEAGPTETPVTISGGPRTEGLGLLRASYTARSLAGLDGVQDGGVVSALLIALLESGQIDGALVARPSDTEQWKGVAHIATDRQGVLDSAGSFYNQTMALAHLDVSGRGLPPNPRLALVGTPCEIQGLKALQSRRWSWGKSHPEAVVLTVALLCTKSFDYAGLMLTELRDRRGISLDDVARVDILHGKLMVDAHDGTRLVEEPIRDFHGAALKGCDECADFLGHGADLSVGSVGSADGYSSLLVRTEAGEAAVAAVADRLELRPLDRPEALDKLNNLDKKTAFGTLARPFEPEGALFIDYAEHCAFYNGTDRQPVWSDQSNA
ncbi:MAG TPA: Coenzyme F420 hydrogenase/dehydrogenase, beta subunit C-terminal domain [Acidimicrobiales bacterium]|nr:Coenzyme F420 hydrogenase/dehydrogenase, beta subunit C-terminal domain [Acidimicrobiales bacterium]